MSTCGQCGVGALRPTAPRSHSELTQSRTPSDGGYWDKASIAHRWPANLNFIPMSDIDAGPWQAQIMTAFEGTADRDHRNLHFSAMITMRTKPARIFSLACFGIFLLSTSNPLAIEGSQNALAIHLFQLRNSLWPVHVQFAPGKTPIARQQTALPSGIIGIGLGKAFSNGQR